VSSRSRSPMGDQYTITCESTSADVTQVGATLRALSTQGVEVLAGFGANADCCDARGQVLIPWANRVKDGRWTDSLGRGHQLPITEPSLGHAIHGLTRWLPWELEERHADRITLYTHVAPQDGWSSTIGCRQTWAVDASGLTSSTSITNLSAAECSPSFGAHPYLAVDSNCVDKAVLNVGAELVFLTDDRMIPTGMIPVAGTKFDLRSDVIVGCRELDHCLTGLVRDEMGRAHVRLHRACGVVDLWFDITLPYVMIYTAHDIEESGRRRQSIGVEPMSAPPNALASGCGLTRLAPEQTTTYRWGITLSPDEQGRS